MKEKTRGGSIHRVTKNSIQAGLRKLLKAGLPGRIEFEFSAQTERDDSLASQRRVDTIREMMAMAKRVNRHLRTIRLRDIGRSAGSFDWMSFARR